jgi:RHS repeat-associated protein
LTTGFTYNGAGDRVAKTVDGVTTEYVLDPAAGLTQVLQETTDGQTTSYLYGHDLLAQYDSGTWAYHLNDGLGSVRQLADPMGQVVASYNFSPFGVPLGESGGQPYGFTGEQWDASAGLVYLRARYYSPEVGRFISKDPFPGHADSPQSFNHWVYVQNNPILAVDPSGYLSNLTIAKAFLGPSATSDDFAEVLTMFERDERWGFLKLLQDAKVGDSIDLATLVPGQSMSESVIESWSVICRNGRIMLSANRYELTLTDVMLGLAHGAYHHPKEFPVWWRESQYWYYLNGHGPDSQTRAYVDWREATETPDFVAFGLQIGRGFVGTGPGIITDRYGNKYRSWSFTIGIGPFLDITYMEGYAGLLGRDPDQILGESELRGLIEELDVGVSGDFLFWGVGWAASYGGASVTFGGGIVGLSGGASYTWWRDKDSEFAWDWLDRIGFTQSDIRKDDSGVDDCGECQSW